MNDSVPVQTRMANRNRLTFSSPSAYLIAIGFVSILGQVVILRELIVSFYGIELIYILALATWLIGTAAGAAAGRRSGRPGERRVQSLLLVTAAALPADIVFVRGFRRIFAAVPGAFLPFHIQLIGMALAVLMLSVATGLLFRWTAKIFGSEGRTLAAAYALESAGGVLGGLVSTLFLAWGFQNSSAGIFCCVCALAVVWFYAARARLVHQRNISAAGLAVMLVVSVFSYRLDMIMTSWDHPHLVESRDTPYGRITVTSWGNQINVFENDALTYETGTTSAEEFVQLSTLQKGRPERVLVLGGGFAGIVDEVLNLPVRRIEYVEINKETIDILKRNLPRGLSGSLNDRRVTVRYDDPRRSLRHAGSYDVILSSFPEPMSAQTNRFYTKEFFRECSANLKTGGVFSFAIRSAENLWTQQLRDRNRSIYAALSSVFRNVVVIPGVTDIFIASDSALTIDPALLVDRLAERHIRTRLVTPQYIRYLYTNDRFADVNAALSKGGIDPNSDVRPACYGHTTSIWLSKFIGGVEMPDARSLRISPILKSPVVWILAAAFIVLAVGRRLSTQRKFLVMLLAGAVGMISETVLLLYYQSMKGVLYQNIGILLMTFMIGLALGAFIIDRLDKKRSSEWKHATWWGVALLAGLGLLNLLIYYGIRTEKPGGLALISLMLVLAGAFVSAVFALISLSRVDARRRAMTWLYSADLMGGAAGSVVAILFLVPVLGMSATSLLAAAMAGGAVIFMRQ